MPDNPERDIEKQLRASAEQRRSEAGAPFELHEATRRLLQAEVARQYGKSQDRPDTTRAWWLALWPRFAAGTALAAVLGCGVWLTVAPHSKEQGLALGIAEKEIDYTRATDQPGAVSQSARRTEIAESETQPALRSEPAPTLASSRDDLKKSESLLKLKSADNSLLPAGTAEPTLAPTVTSTLTRASAAPPLEIASARLKAGSEQALNDAFAPAGTGGDRGGFGGGGGASGSARQPDLQRRMAEPEIVTASSASDSATALGQPRSTFTANGSSTGDLAILARQQTSRAKQNAEPATWYFRNQAVPPGGRSGGASGGRGGARTPTPTAPVARTVLNNFRVEQTGDDLRIVDEDGSVYTGKLQTITSQAAPDEAKSFASRQGERARAASTAVDMKRAEEFQQDAPVNFNVSGLNRSLSQQVVFTGQWQQAMSQNSLNNQTGAFFVATPTGVNAPQSNSAVTQSQPAPVPQPQQRVVGRARLEDARELRVDAVIVQP